MKRKRKIYLDTSVISHLDAPDVPDKMADTWRLWQLFEQDSEFEPVISVVTQAEILQCPEPKREQMVQWLKSLNCKIFDETREVLELANEYINRGILSPKHFDDILHIAHAVTKHCECIASWNFKHIVNLKTIDGVCAANIILGYPSIKIVSPTMLIQGEDDE